MCVVYAGRADAVWAGAEWGHYAKCPFSYPPLYPPLSFLDYLQFKLEHSSQIFLDTIKSSQTHPLPMIFVRKFYGKVSNPLSFTGSGTRRPFRLVKQY